MPPTPRKHVVAISPSYVDELRAQVEAVGVSAVAEAAGLARQTVWRQLTGGSGRNPNPDGIERIRRALAKLDKAEPMPPPLVEVRGRAHHAWIKIADTLDAADLERVAKDPAAVTAMVKRGTRSKRGG